MNKELYEKIKERYGKHASWAIWPLEDLWDYEKIKGKIKPNIVMVGLNAPGEIEEDFKNFHYPGYEKDTTHDGKLRYTFKCTEFEGAYMTDIIKYNTIKGKVSNASKSKEVMSDLEKSAILRDNIDSFKEELEFIGSKNPLIIALGGNAFNILKENGFKRMSKLIWTYHHAYRYNGCSKPEIYKEKAWKKIREQLP